MTLVFTCACSNSKYYTLLYWTLCAISFCLRDNSVHLHECSPFYVCIFIISQKKTTMFTVWCRHAHSDWQITEVFLYVIRKSNIMFPWTYIIVLDIYGKHNFKHIIGIPAREQTRTNIKLIKQGISDPQCIYLFNILVFDQSKHYTVLFYLSFQSICKFQAKCFMSHTEFLLVEMCFLLTVFKVTKYESLKHLQIHVFNINQI